MNPFLGVLYMADKYDAGNIYPLLNKVLFCSLSNHPSEKEPINARFMVFACEKNLSKFYFLTHKETLKVRELKKQPVVTASILSTAEVLDDYSETIVHGTAKIMTEFSDKTVQAGFKSLIAKSGMIKMLYDSGSMGDYVMIVLESHTVNFRVYKDILKNVPKTVIRY